MDLITVYATFPNREVAESAINESLKKNQIACANLIPNAISYFTWKSKTTKQAEVVVFMKSSKDRYQELENTLKKFNPYECPCIVAYSIEEGYDLYLNWVEESLARRK